jgi:hypothetical protein
VSHAWHWFDPERAVQEIARVLVDGGRPGVPWTSRDRDEDWVAGLEVIGSPDVPRTPDQAMERLSRQHSVTMPEGAPFRAAQTASFGFERIMTVADALDWLATASQVITADPADRHRNGIDADEIVVPAGAPAAAPSVIRRTRSDLPFGQQGRRWRRRESHLYVEASADPGPGSECGTVSGGD